MLGNTLNGTGTERQPWVRPWMVVLVVVLVVASAGLVFGLARAHVGPGDDVTASGAGTRHSRTIHVAPDGDDDAGGSEAEPMRTITAAVRASQPGGTIEVGSGTYRESLVIEGRPDLELVAAPGAEVWLDGSVVVPGWSSDGEHWVAGGWTAAFDSSPTYNWGEDDHTQRGWTFIDPKFPLAAHPDQVWIDGVRQVQVGSRDEVGEDSFFVDYDRDELVLGSDPTGRTVTASTQAQALRIRSAGMLVRGIGIRKYAPSVPHMGAVTVEAPDVTVEDVTVTDSATTGLHVLSHDVTLSDVDLERNGMMGLSATGADDLELVRVVVRGNNVERFNKSPAAGGAKIGRSSGVVVEDCEFAGNLGNGLWFDESSYDITIVHSRSVDNAGHGISVEVSGEAAIVGNVVARNAENGLKLNDAEDVQVWNNTFVDNSRSINVVQDQRDRNPRGTYRDPDLPLTWQTQSIEIRNNVLAHSGATEVRGDRSRTCLLCVEDYSGRWTAAEMDVTALGNVYQRPDATSPKWMIVWSRREKDPFVFQSVSQFQATVQQEEMSAEFTGTSVLTEGLEPEPALVELYATVAQPLPEELAQITGKPVGERHLGAWTS